MIILLLIEDDSPTPLYNFTAANPTAFVLLVRYGHGVLVDRITRPFVAYLLLIRLGRVSDDQEVQWVLGERIPFLNPPWEHWRTEFFKVVSTLEHVEQLYEIKISSLTPEEREMRSWVRFGDRFCKAGGLAGDPERWPDMRTLGLRMRVVDWGLTALGLWQGSDQSGRQGHLDVPEVYRRRFFKMSHAYQWI